MFTYKAIIFLLIKKESSNFVCASKESSVAWKLLLHISIIICNRTYKRINRNKRQAFWLHWQVTGNIPPLLPQQYMASSCIVIITDSLSLQSTLTCAFWKAQHHVVEPIPSMAPSNRVDILNEFCEKYFESMSFALSCCAFISIFNLSSNYSWNKLTETR